ncbi:sensor histidine kinase [Actinocrinis puniceicyclus]|uniref:histidine kinase n=1 Tax=Actinocrinis puniceicyclus TaxID=977794 RepID=A0A8J7WNN6_9ACTN|nr:sensor histidine kinase [Actinocrinis puniceicyclus]MBS2963047.1 sensor histidine kinase [Actinocrinis puniceicyclus]
MRRSPMRRLSTQILASQIVILVAVVVVGFSLFAYQQRSQLDAQYEQRAADIAATVAGIPEVGACLETEGGACGDGIQQIANRVMSETGASYVVVIDMNRVRHSHPDRALIGQQVSEPIVTVDRAIHVRINDGSTGRSANGRAPLYGPDGVMVGEVSAGIKESSVTAELSRELPVEALWVAAALAAAALASWLLAVRLKRRTFGLELDEITTLLQEREATLHGIREGVIAFDPAGRVAMINDEARRLLSLGAAGLGGRLEDLVAEGRLRDVLSGEIAGQDQVVLTDDYLLTVNRMPVTLAGRPHGAVVTLRDRTELSGLLRELDSVRGLTDALRAQQHEFSNRMHTVAGLLELGEADEALRYLTDLEGAQAEFAESVRSRIASPLIVGLILGKAAVAGERGVILDVSDDTLLGDAPEKAQALTTILGNLIDNAFEALCDPGGDPDPRRTPGDVGRVEVSVFEDEDAIVVRVADDGPGIAPGAAGSVFVDGYTTKPRVGSRHRGLGLALVHRLVQRLGGQIDVSEGPGAVFTVRLPKGSRRYASRDLVKAAAG